MNLHFARHKRVLIPDFPTIASFRPDGGKPTHQSETRPLICDVPVSELDQMISMGWGTVPRGEVPDNWREVKGPGKVRRKK